MELEHWSSSNGARTMELEQWSSNCGRGVVPEVCRGVWRGWSAGWAGGFEGCPALVNRGLDGGLSEYLRAFGGVVEGVDDVVLNGGHPDDRLVALGPGGQTLEGKLSFSLVGDIVESWFDTPGLVTNAILSKVST